MTDKKLDERLEDLASQIELRISELKKRGEFTELHKEAVEKLKAKHSALREKFDDTFATGDLWEALKQELKLDLDSLIDSFRHWEGRLDDEEMRNGFKRRG